MSVIKKHKKGIAFVVALLAAVVFILPGSVSTVKAADGTYSIAVSKKAGATFENAGVQVTFYDAQNATGSQLDGSGYYGISAPDYTAGTDAGVIKEAAKSVKIRVTTAGQDLEATVTVGT
nr:hypothetical protein [Parasporobacterium sp.]